MTDSPWTWRGRVYWEDTDAGGVVYHARYLQFLERARSDWLRALGFPQVDLRSGAGCVFAVTRMHLDFRVPARLEDELEVTVAIKALGRVRLDFDQEIRRAGGELLVAAAVRAACLDADTFRPRPIPEPLMAALRSGEQDKNLKETES